uniref:Uncharacterized protein n=1 Tax=Spodoptera frugiperda nuclear polyhedrosis virus TaxID=10455 RepID=B2KWT9_NPVSF|nr:unknown [Spodoptera frugiperda multiple nucleopolyhedrovirus]QWS70917.1 hypothetical protein [Spodoptera frugiperda multiple nucleopolyhedrovirus]
MNFWTSNNNEVSVLFMLSFFVLSICMCISLTFLWLGLFSKLFMWFFFFDCSRRSSLINTYNFRTTPCAKVLVCTCRWFRRPPFITSGR